MMYLNTLKSAQGARKKRFRVGRGPGSGLGKTCGKGHKGQLARAGGFKVGFEGGQMPLIRRLPKLGFNSRKARLTTEVKLSELEKLSDTVITLDVLKLNKVVARKYQFAKIILSGSLSRAVTVQGIKVTRGAQQAIESAGGKVEE